MSGSQFVENTSEHNNDYIINAAKEMMQGSYAEEVKKLVQKHGVQTLVFENRKMSVSEYEKFRRAAGCQLVPLEGRLEKIREIKEEAEVECIVIAQRFAEQAFEELLNSHPPRCDGKTAGGRAQLPDAVPAGRGHEFRYHRGIRRQFFHAPRRAFGQTGGKRRSSSPLILAHCMVATIRI